MKIVLSQHAKGQVQIRRILLRHVEIAIRTPNQIVPSFRGRFLYQRVFGDKMLEVVAIEENQIITVITAYYLIGKSL